MRLLLGLLFALYLHAAIAQTALQMPAQPSTQPQAVPQLSPQAAYDEAARPLDITRRAVENWSDVEQAALAIAIAQAKDSCLARNPYQYTGEDLIAYARLCAFAQMWEHVQQAATGYLIARNAATPEEKLTGFPNLAMAFDYEVQASLKLNNSDNAFGTAQTMLRTVPYDDLTSEATNATYRYVQLIYTDEALELLKQRQPILLSLLRAHAAPSATAVASAHPLLSVHELYADAIDLPAMLQFANEPKAAAAAFAELEGALPASLSPDDAILTAQSRRQYLLLGAPMPVVAATTSLLDTAAPAPPKLNGNFGAATVLFLFPDWCAQCVGKGQSFSTATAALEPSGARFYALLAQDAPPAPAVKTAAKTPAKSGAASAARTGKALSGTKTETAHVDVQVGVKPTPAQLLEGTPTLIVPKETVDTFAATDFPLIIVVDHQGIVRDIQTAPDNALAHGGLVEQLAARVLEQWPPPAQQPRPKE